ncbi:Cochaperone protein [Exophiala xenobiotica]|nr:Cochaperone protein [Exophiala xenobiotica]KAK5396118.1 Cochaperone protein [Exophiala xenobiotica]KAK5424071.1 Cochaperone protein [Exophiala xenobiotica]KAK5479874.1 Cochaperone protein [Exophiala xenobiotica]KAK5490550.1 Cochaperone protein [Exophiala xenobiotica]
MASGEPASDLAGDTGETPVVEVFVEDDEFETLVAMEDAARGAKALEDRDLPGALNAYTRALIEHPLSPDYLTQRSIAFTRLKPPRHDLALKDAELAVLSAQKRAVREKIYAAQFRRMVSLCGLGRYADAAFLVEKLRPLSTKDSKTHKMEVDMWDAKIKTKQPEQEVSITEFPDYPLPSEKDMLQQLKMQLDAHGKYIFPEEAAATTTTTAAAIPISEESTSAAPTAPPAGMTMDGAADDRSSAEVTPTSSSSTVPKIRHEWYQNNQSVTLTFYAKGVAKDAADIEINDDSVYITFPHPSNPDSTFTFTLDPLFALVDPAQSTANVMSTKIEINLRKAQAGQKWHTLEGSAPLKRAEANSDPDITTSTTNTPLQPASSTATAPAYPTSSRTGPKNWDKLANDLHAKSKAKPKIKKDTRGSGSESTSQDDGEAEVDSDYESGDAVDGFFKKIYAHADPDTQRAMMKSYVESNGTSLSTNWGEVSKGKVEVVKSKDEA